MLEQNHNCQGWGGGCVFLTRTQRFCAVSQQTFSVRLFNVSGFFLCSFTCNWFSLCAFHKKISGGNSGNYSKEVHTPTSHVMYQQRETLAYPDEPERGGGTTHFSQFCWILKTMNRHYHLNLLDVWPVLSVCRLKSKPVTKYFLFNSHEKMNTALIIHLWLIYSEVENSLKKKNPPWLFIKYDNPGIFHRMNRATLNI